jgi:excisionase family DNA binding protein
MKSTLHDYMTLTEAAKALGIHRTTLQKWMTRSDFKCPPFGKMGGRYRFKREDIEKFIKESMEH